jgi:hypothetical protein
MSQNNELYFTPWIPIHVWWKVEWIPLSIWTPSRIPARNRALSYPGEWGRDRAQAVSRRLPTAAARFRVRVWSCGICGGQSGAGALRSPMPIFIPPISSQSPSSVIWGWYNRSVVAAVPSGVRLTPLIIIIIIITRRIEWNVRLHFRTSSVLLLFVSSLRHSAREPFRDPWRLQKRGQWTSRVSDAISAVKKPLVFLWAAGLFRFLFKAYTNNKVAPVLNYAPCHEDIQGGGLRNHYWGVSNYVFYFSHGVRLSPLGTAATVWPIVPAPDDRWWLWSNRWNANWQGKPKYKEKTCPSTTLSTTNPTWPDPGSNLGRRGGKPATNRLSYGMAISGGWVISYKFRQLNSRGKNSCTNWMEGCVDPRDGIDTVVRRENSAPRLERTPILWSSNP